MRPPTALAILITVMLSLTLPWLLFGCTESATQWGHQKQAQEDCRAAATSEQERSDCGN